MPMKERGTVMKDYKSTIFMSKKKAFATAAVFKYFELKVSLYS